MLYRSFWAAPSLTGFLFSYPRLGSGFGLEIPQRRLDITGRRELTCTAKPPSLSGWIVNVFTLSGRWDVLIIICASAASYHAW
jgi:hypothetical protein